ncbi:hypothetical protein [Pseudomonas aeruginosa]|uniref:hypothetical protein n=2 Tax=Pseudomonas TaxID=286 RepID=UPI000FC42267|nr:hypothetical protein [Pseudomonas aeruginosa]RUE48088.1 hypothetical protein IPC1224_30235 [Pseudomonas aeruginosa]HBO1307556.1 hypothetical protein [Pseudomonas aeruginosa]HEJ5892306.1 hypothetical protein [Pseudomonas aeruginosa]
MNTAFQCAQSLHDDATPDDTPPAANSDEFCDWAEHAVNDLRCGMDVKIETMRERVVVFASTLTERVQAELLKLVQADEECWLAQMFQAAEDEFTSTARECAANLEQHQGITERIALGLLKPHADLVLEMIAEQNMEDAA